MPVQPAVTSALPSTLPSASPPAGAEAGAASPEPARICFVDLVFNVPLAQQFTYAVPESWAQAPALGARVYASFGPRRLTGLVVATHEDFPEGRASRDKVKELLEPIDDGSVLDEDLLRLIRWAADYYHSPLGMTVFTALPPGTSRKDDAAVERVVAEGEPAEGGAGDAPLPPWLAALQPGEPITVAALQRREGLSLALVDRYVRRGLLRRSRRDRGPGARARSERVLRWVGAELPGARAPKRRAVAAYLQAQGETSLAALRERFGEGAREACRALEAAELVAATTRRVFRDPFADKGLIERDEAPVLSAEQQLVVDSIGAGLDGGFQAHLCHGITGSGKTEVYLQLIRRLRGQGRSALVLVPEIALTPQLAGRFRARFGEDVAVLHSGLTPGQRLDEWDRIRQGIVPVVVGARSAVFAPLPKLGLIVVDEEHDSSYKQGDGVRYHARDVALVRGKLQDCPVLLGSATPSLESLSNAWRLRSTLHSLRDRPTGAPLPVVEIIDMRKAERVAGADFLSEELRDELAKTVRAGKQAIVYHNRRGHSPFLLCPTCGEVPACQHCSISLTWHQARSRLVCHYCGFQKPKPRRCELCASESLELRGVGTERLEEALAHALPDLDVLRFDADSARGGKHEKLLADFRAGRYQIMVGTQMVTKGHDFPNVHLVGVLSAEHGLKLPDFRAAEHTLQRLVQVAGRAGRSGERGRVLVQSYTPEHYALPYLLDHDWLGFARTELELREDRGFPPAGHLALLELRARDAILAERDLLRLREALERWVEERGRAPFHLRGPSPAPMKKIKDVVRFHLLVGCESRVALRNLLREVRDLPECPDKLIVDVDPVGLM